MTNDSFFIEILLLAAPNGGAAAALKTIGYPKKFDIAAFSRQMLSSGMETMEISDSYHDLVRRIQDHTEAIASPANPWLSGPIPLTDVLEAEAALGFPLPPLLREIYLHVGYGRLGLGGWLLPLVEKGGIVELHQYLRIETHIPPELEDPMPVWPEQLIPFWDWGCADRSCVDCSKPEAPVYWLEARWEADTPPSLQSPSLATWLEAALNRAGC